MRRLDTQSVLVKQPEQATAQARAELLCSLRSQRDTLATSFDDLLGDGGPSDETADEMIQAIWDWREAPSNGKLAR